MKIKVKKSWLPDGTIVIEARDHDLPAAPQRATSQTWYTPNSKKRALLYSMQLPRATPKMEVKVAMRTLKRMLELRTEGVQ